MSRRKGRPMRTYLQVSRDMAAAAAREAARESLRPVIEALVLQVVEFHQHAYPECEGGCPAQEAVAEAKKALGHFRHWPLR